jgi:protein tyrosine phosphatase (PTP) superfamily phosphohydrolase (DUF442 family)
MNVSLQGRCRSARLPRSPVGVTAIGLLGAAVLAFAGCGSTQPTGGTPAAAVVAPSEVVLDASGRPAGIENFRRWSDRIGQGGQPQGDVAFANITAMGYRTILSVDGARPDAETAARYGLTYVHVPFGYDGVPKDAQVRIVKAVACSDGPVFVHCHHGVARGPAGAMIARIAIEGISNAEAAAELKESGCDEHYKGLYRDVLAAVPPTPAELAQVPAKLPSYVSTGDLAEQMASLDRTWARVGKAKAAAWSTPLANPDVDPAHEARILWEKLREIGRLGDTGHGADFGVLLARAEQHGHALEEALLSNDAAAAAASFDGVRKSCAACHDRWRDAK